MITGPDGKVYRNLQEQVLKNKCDIEDHEERITALEEGGGGAVTSVNGKTGAVVLNASDIRATNSQTIQQNLERIDLEVEGLIDDVADLNSGKLDASKQAISTAGGLVIPATTPVSDELVGIGTAHTQTRVSIGSGLTLNNNVLSATGGPGTSDILVITTNLRDESGYPTLTYSQLLSAYYDGVDSNKAVLLKVTNQGGDDEYFQVTTVAKSGSHIELTYVFGGEQCNIITGEFGEGDPYVTAVPYGGGGEEPAAYLKNASVSGNTLSLTKKDNTIVTFTPTNEPASYIKDASVVGSTTLMLTKKDNTTVVFEPPYNQVSGTEDGTNWTSITIDSVTRNIPSGGGGGSTVTMPTQTITGWEIDEESVGPGEFKFALTKTLTTQERGYFQLYHHINMTFTVDLDCPDGTTINCSIPIYIPYGPASNEFPHYPFMYTNTSANGYVKGTGILEMSYQYPDYTELKLVFVFGELEPDGGSDYTLNTASLFCQAINIQ